MKYSYDFAVIEGKIPMIGFPANGGKEREYRQGIF